MNEFDDGVYEHMVRRRLPKTNSWFQRVLCRLFKNFDITKDVLYLRRWRLFAHPWGDVNLHYIPKPDFDPDPHDHPWNFTVIILRGGYTEWTWPKPKNFGEWDTHRRGIGIRSMKAEGTHQIREHLKSGGTWSLMFCGLSRRIWGFWVDGEWVDFKTYLGWN